MRTYVKESVFFWKFNKRLNNAGPEYWKNHTVSYKTILKLSVCLPTKKDYQNPNWFTLHTDNVVIKKKNLKNTKQIIADIPIIVCTKNLIT